MTQPQAPSEVDIIVPTLALARRRHHIFRALESVFEQRGVTATPIVVVNGPSPDPGVVESLSADPRVRLVVYTEPGIPRALRAGRALVRAPFFGALDDDDLLLPGALAARVAALHADPERDAVISNGVRRDREGDTLHIPDLGEVSADPIRAMIRRNWLLPGAWLARTEVLSPTAFDGMPEFLECTYLGLWLASQCRLAFISEPGVVWCADSPAAAHLGREFVRGQPKALRALMGLPLPGDVQHVLQQKVRLALHNLAAMEWDDGNRMGALGWHLRSLASRGGWRHLAFTRHLFWRKPD